LLKARQVIPLGGGTDGIEGEVGVEEVSDKLKADVCKVLHDE